MTDGFWVRLGVKGAIFRSHRLLLLRRRNDLDLWPGLWDLPGGGVEKEDGTLDSALAREALEETGFNVRVGPVLDVSFQWIRVRAEPAFPSIVSCFRCSTWQRGQPRLDPSEHTDFAWVRRRDLSGLAAVPRLRRAMERALLGRERRVRVTRFHRLEAGGFRLRPVSPTHPLVPARPPFPHRDPQDPGPNTEKHRER